MILTREECTDGDWILCENDRVDGSHVWMAEGPDELNTVQVVEADCAIKASSNEQAHFIVDVD